MIQDILNPVYYIETFHILNMKTNVTSLRSGKYRNVVDLEVNFRHPTFHNLLFAVITRAIIFYFYRFPGR